MALDFKALLREERERLRKELLLEEERVVLVGKSSNTTSTGVGNDLSGQVAPVLPIEKKDQLSVVEESQHFSLNSILNLENFRLKTDFNSIYYLPNILSEEYSSFLLDCINAASENWTKLRTRELQLWGKMPQDYLSNGSKASFREEIPGWLQDLIEESMRLGLFPDQMRPNNVLINHYEADQGILHHTDGPSYCSRVAIFSLQSSCVMSFKPKLASAEIGVLSDDDVLSVILPPRSLLIFAEDLYEKYMHGIYPEEAISTIGEHGLCVNAHLENLQEGDKITREERTSITLRRVIV